MHTDCFSLDFEVLAASRTGKKLTFSVTLFFFFIASKRCYRVTPPPQIQSTALDLGVDPNTFYWLWRRKTVSHKMSIFSKFVKPSKVQICNIRDLYAHSWWKDNQKWLDDEFTNRSQPASEGEDLRWIFTLSTFEQQLPNLAGWNILRVHFTPVSPRPVEQINENWNGKRGLKMRAPSNNDGTRDVRWCVLDADIDDRHLSEDVDVHVQRTVRVCRDGVPGSHAGP